MTSSTVDEPRLETIPFPSREDFQQLIDELDEVYGKLDALEVKFRSIAGEIPTEVWAARFESPPTLADLGAFAVFMDDLELNVGELSRTLRGFRSSWRTMTMLAAESSVSYGG